MKTFINSETLQKTHIDNIILQYEAHYDDPCSQQYRLKFIYTPMFDGINLSGSKVLEAMCGSGQTTQYLLSKGAIVTALDISNKGIERFKERWPNCNAICRSIFDTELEDNSFDCVIVVAGLHHLYPNTDLAVKEIYRILKVGGYFCFLEPHSGSLPNLFRKIWYKYDKLITENETAIDMNKLKNSFSLQFKFVKEKYMGNIAHLLVLNSMVFRIPLWLKPIYTPFLMRLESIISKFQGKRLFCLVLCQWQKIIT